MYGFPGDSRYPAFRFGPDDDGNYEMLANACTNERLSYQQLYVHSFFLYYAVANIGLPISVQLGYVIHLVQFLGHPKPVTESIQQIELFNFQRTKLQKEMLDTCQIHAHFCFQQGFHQWPFVQQK